MKLSNEAKRNFRSRLFRYLDGLAILPIALGLEKKKLLSRILEENEITLEKLVNEDEGLHKGYVNVGLRNLASQGWIDYQIDTKQILIKAKPKLKSSLAQLNANDKQIHLLTKYNNLFSLDAHEYSLKMFEELSKEALLVNYENLNVEFQLLLKGVVISPLIVLLAYKRLVDFNLEHKIPHIAFGPKEKSLMDMLKSLNLGESKGNRFVLSEEGYFLFRRSVAFGVPVSYIPILANIEAFLFGNFEDIRTNDEMGREKHVYRAMNVWGSGGAHRTYFKKFDEIIIEIFNKPIEEQPKGIIDIGCGNGAFLEHIFDIIWDSTLRRQYLKDQPLFIVGTDYNREALEVTKRNLEEADIWAEVIWGDIGDPKGIAENLKRDFNVDLSELLNVRSFLDHNRIFNFPQKELDDESKSTGAYAFKGKYLSNNAVEQSLVEHLENWAPYVSKYGLLLIELHTVDPQVVAQNLGRTAITSYDATHGFSDQYIVELDVFREAAQKAGLISDDRYFHKFPDSDFASVSIQLLRAN